MSRRTGSSRRRNRWRIVLVLRLRRTLPRMGSVRRSETMVRREGVGWASSFHWRMVVQWSRRRPRSRHSCHVLRRHEKVGCRWCGRARFVVPPSSSSMPNVHSPAWLRCMGGLRIQCTGKHRHSCSGVKSTTFRWVLLEFAAAGGKALSACQKAVLPLLSLLLLLHFDQRPWRRP